MHSRLGLPVFLLGVSLVACLSKGDTIISQGPAVGAGAGGSGGEAGGGAPSGGSAGQPGGSAGSSGSTPTAGQPGGGAAGSGPGGSGASGLCVETSDSCNANATRFACGRCGVDEGCHSLLDQADRCGGCDRTCEVDTTCKGAKAAFGCSSKEIVSLSKNSQNLDQISAPRRLANGSVFVFEGPSSGYSLRRYSKGAGSQVLDLSNALAAASDEQNLFVLDGVTGVTRVGDDGSSATQKNLVPRVNPEPATGGSIETIALGNQVVSWSEAYTLSPGVLQWCLYAASRDTGAILSNKSPIDGCKDKALLGFSGNYILGIGAASDDWIAVTSTQSITTIDPSKGTTFDIPLGEKVPYVCWGDVALSGTHVFFFGGQTDPKQTPTGTAPGCSIYRSKRDDPQGTPELLVDGENGGIVYEATQVGFRSPRLRYLNNSLYFLIHRPAGASAGLLDTVMRVSAHGSAPVAPGLFTSVVDPTHEIEGDFSIAGDTMTFQGRVGELYSVRSVSVK
jgi:hypothetical protein